jgi:hypothetical protein
MPTPPRAREIASLRGEAVFKPFAKTCLIGTTSLGTGAATLEEVHQLREQGGWHMVFAGAVSSSQQAQPRHALVAARRMVVRFDLLQAARRRCSRAQQSPWIVMTWLGQAVEDRWRDHRTAGGEAALVRLGAPLSRSAEIMLRGS